jgi:hypothetical protein
VISNDPTVSPHPRPCDPLYTWDIDPDRDFEATERYVIFDRVERDIPMRAQAQPVVDQGKVFSAHGRSVPGAGAPVADLRHVRRRPGAHSERSHQLIGYGNWSRAGSNPPWSTGRS